MAKFKVGDKVRVKPYSSSFPYVGIGKLTLQSLAGDVYTVKSHRDSDVTAQWYNMTDSPFSFAEEMLELAEQPRREFIVIHRSGNVMTAEHRVNREIIKSAKATCAPSDTFDFDTGAKLAFDRLMGREEPKPAPKPAHKFKVGDRVLHEKYGLGTIIGYLDFVPSVPYLVEPDNGNCFMNHWAEAAVSHAPAPEPPKFYTGKVFCAGCDAGCEWAYKDLIGKVLEIENGNAAWLCFDSHYTSFEDMCNRNNSGKWYEVKE